MSPQLSARTLWLLSVLLVALTAFTCIRETHRWRRSPFGDFNYLQLGAQCLSAGCDPYDFAQLNHHGEALHQKRPYVWPMTPVYPPSSLLVVMPFAGLGWPLAAYTWNAIGSLSVALTCMLLVWRLRLGPCHPMLVVFLAALTTNPIHMALEFGNPALLGTGLAVCGCVLLLEQDCGYWLGWLLLGLSIALKPQLAGAALLPLLWRPETRAAALKACALAATLLVIGLLAYRIRLGSFHFLRTLQWVLGLSVTPGGSSDFTNDEGYDFLNIQTALVHLPHAGRLGANLLAWAVTLALAAATLWSGLKRHAVRQRPWTLLALCVAISALPVYHRGYDRILGLLLAPAAFELARDRRWLAWLYALLLAFWVANDTLMAHIVRRWRFAPQNGVEDVLFCFVLLFSLWLPENAAQQPAQLSTAPA